MDLRQLQYFVEVAKKQHVTQAAEELHVAQSAVSRQIHQLEEELGLKLFIQQGRNVSLTPAGRMFLERVERVMADLQRAIHAVQEFMDPELGEVRLGFPHSLGVNLVPRIISAFRQEHPKVTFRFKQGKYNSLMQDVLSGEVDLAFISPCPEKHDHVSGEVLLTEELYVTLPPNHKLAGERALKLEQLRNEPFVLFSEGYSLRPIVWEACRRAGFTPEISFEGEETDTIRGLVAAGMGVSLLPELALTDCSGLQPAKVKIADQQVTRTIGVIRRSHEKLPTVAEAFRRFVLDYFQ